MIGRENQKEICLRIHFQMPAIPEEPRMPLRSPVWVAGAVFLCLPGASAGRRIGL